MMMMMVREQVKIDDQNLPGINQKKEKESYSTDHMRTFQMGVGFIITNCICLLFLFLFFFFLYITS